MNRYRKLFSNTVILGIGTFASKLLVFLLMPLYTALLSTAEYSTAELIMGTANLLIPIACVGISNGIFRFACDKAQDKKKIFSSSVALLCCGLGGFLLLSPLLLLADYLRAYTWLIVAYVFFANLQSVCAQYVRAVDKTKLFAIQGILNTLLTVLCNLLFLIVFDLGVVGYVLSVVVGNIVTTVFLILTAKLWQVFSVSSIDKGSMGELLRFSLPLIPTTLCWLITDLSDRYLVTYFCGAEVNGIYSAAYKIPTVVTLLSSIFMQAWQFSAVAEASDEEECSRFYTNVFSGFISFVMIGATGLLLFSGLLTRLLLSTSFHGAVLYMPTLLISAALEALVSFLATVYLVRKKSMHSFLTAMAGAVLNILLNVWWIPLFDRLGYAALGAAIATLTSYAAVLVIRLIDAPRWITFRRYTLRVTGSALILLGLGAVVTFSLPYSILWMTLLTVGMLALNGYPLWKSAAALLKKRGNG
ncbi:MAG: oligosaccharide flippase family protein [Clostridia bacterium]|nr:oligosaccharide flippase family protein [Clostridia bacterium]